MASNQLPPRRRVLLGRGHRHEAQLGGGAGHLRSGRRRSGFALGWSERPP